jgi:hypothetical protein
MKKEPILVKAPHQGLPELMKIQKKETPLSDLDSDIDNIESNPVPVPKSVVKIAEPKPIINIVEPKVEKPIMYKQERVADTELTPGYKPESKEVKIAPPKNIEELKTITLDAMETPKTIEDLNIVKKLNVNNDQDELSILIDKSTQKPSLKFKTKVKKEDKEFLIKLIPTSSPLGNKIYIGLSGDWSATVHMIEGKNENFYKVFINNSFKEIEGTLSERGTSSRSNIIL